MTFLAFLLAAALAVLTLYGEKHVDRPFVVRVNRILGFAGLGLLAASLAAAAVTVLRCARTPAAREWVLTVTAGFALLVVSVFALVMLSLLIAALLLRGRRREKGRSRVIRIALSAAGSAACLLLSAFWCRLSAGGYPDLSHVLFAAGVGLSLILRFTLPAEYRN